MSRLRAAAALCLTILIVALFGQTLRFPLVVYDDPGYVLSNPLVTGSDPAAWIQIWDPRHEGGRHLGQYAPVRDSLFRLEYQLAGATPVVFHAVNLALHVACTLGLLLLLLSLGLDFSAAFIASALFAVHPLAVEVVAWVSGRKDSLGLLLSLGALGLLRVATRRDSVVAAAGTMLLWLLAVLAKPTYVVVPAIAVLLAWGLPALRPRRRVVWIVGLAAPLVVSVCAALVVAWQIPSMAYDSARTAGLLPYPWVMGYALVEYLGLLFWPSGLAPVHPIRADLLTAGHHFLWSLPLAAFALLGVALVVRRHRLGLALWGIFFLPLLPVLLLLPNTVLYADRFLYTPRIAPGVLLAIVVARAARQASRPALRAAAVTAAACAGAVLYGTTLVYSMTFATTRSMWEHAHEVDPRAFVAEVNLAVSSFHDHFPEEAVRHWSLAEQWGVGDGQARMMGTMLHHPEHDDCACRAIRAARGAGIGLPAEWTLVFSCRIPLRLRPRQDLP